MWTAAQDPALIRAIRHTFCKHGGYHGHTCLTDEDRHVLSAWVEKTVMRGLSEDGRLAVGVTGDVVVLPEIDPADRWAKHRAWREGDPNEPCWFPTCTKGNRHGGLHDNIANAGRRLAELEAAIERGELVWKVA